MELVLITPDLVAAPILRIVGQDSSEITGPALDPFEGRLVHEWRAARLRAWRLPPDRDRSPEAYLRSVIRAFGFT